MANNRMYLQYRPTGELVYLGKRMSDGWYDVPTDLTQKLQLLFDHAEASKCELDDFILSLEHPGNDKQVESPDELHLLL